MKKSNGILPYTYHRIIRILDAMGLKAEKLWQGYKGDRHNGYCELYKITRQSDGKIIADRICLDSLRLFFTVKGIPLRDEKSISKRIIQKE